MDWLFKNPVFIKELRSKMRQRRAYTLLTLYLIILGFGFYICYSVNVLFDGQVYYVKPDYYAGKNIFIVIAILQLLLMIGTPLTFSTTSITLEKEERTYNLLRVTPLTPFSIVMGKLLFSLAYIFLLLVVSIPVAFMIPYLGGLSFIQVLKVYLVIMATAMTLSIFGIYCSTTFSKGSHATGIFYGALFIFILLPSLFGVPIFECTRDNESIWAGITANPFWTIIGILIGNDTTKIFQFEVPIWFLYFISNLLLSFFIGSLAINGLMEVVKRYTIWIRLSFLILFVFITFINLGSMVLLSAEKYSNFNIFIYLHAMLFIFIVWAFCFGEVSKEELKFSSLFNLKRVFHQQSSTSILYIVLLIITSSIIIFSGAYFGKIFPKPYLLCLILFGIFVITLGWGSFGLLLNSLFKSRMTSRGLFFFILTIVTLGVILPGMPHYLIDKEKIGFIGGIIIHLHPIFPVCSLIDKSLLPEVISKSNIAFFWHAISVYTIFFLLNMNLLGIRKYYQRRKK